MKPPTLARPLGPAALFLVQAAIVSPAVAVGLFSEVLLIEGDQMVGTAFGNASSDTGAFVSASGNVTHDTSEIGGSGELTFSGQGSASAGYQVLRSRASGALSNSYFDPEYNFDAGTGTVPTAYVTQSIARFEETLVYGGTATGYNSRYFFRVTGNITGRDAFASVSLSHAQATPQFWFFDEPGPFNEVITSESFVGAANLGFSVELLTAFNADTEFLEPGEGSSGSANFGSTLELLGIEARDSVTGELLATADFTSGSGTVYQIREAIPEPSATALAAVAALAAFRKKRSDRPGPASGPAARR